MRAKRKVTRRTTPADDPTVLMEWKELEAHGVYELGMPRYRVWEMIGELYGGVSRSGVMYHLDQTEFYRKKNSPTPSVEQVKAPRFRERHALQNMLYRKPERVIVPLFETADTELTLDDITDRLFEAHSYFPRAKTIEKYAHKGDWYSKSPILELIPSSDPPRYRLQSGLFDQYALK